MIPRARLICLVLFCTPAAFAQNWITPTPAELSMTSQPEVPGAAAVYLNREETANDILHVFSIYARIKILNNAGKEYANVEIPYAAGESGLHVDEVSGRTIHADGTVVPLTEKPYQKLIEKSKDYKVMETIFTMPSVETGSIVEYRYKLRFEENYVRSPDWIVQTNLYTRNAHFLWTPTHRYVLVNGQAIQDSVAWTPILPPGAMVKQSQDMAAAQLLNDGRGVRLELTVHDIPPLPREEHMLPIDSVAYKVLFYYTPYRTSEEYWKEAGKLWSGEENKFVGPDAGVKAEVQKLVAPADSSEQKLRKFYAAVMEMENTDFTRAHSKSEDKAEGLGTLKSTDDVLSRKRGSGDELTGLFVAMARAAGMKAYVMRVPDRSRSVFIPVYLNVGQLKSDVAIVNVDGKERFFDPGSRYCAFGHLSWKHALASGIREIDGGTVIAEVPGEPYKAAHVTRVANLTMNDSGEVSGKVVISFAGDPALEWRQEDLRTDDVTFSHTLRDYAQGLLPHGLEVQLDRIEHLTDYDVPLVVSYDVKGSVGSAAGKRLAIPGDLFEINQTPLFPEEKRELTVDMHFGEYVQDVVHINLPKSLAIEVLPVAGEWSIPQEAVYNFRSEQNATSYTIRRDLGVAQVYFPTKSYPDLRGFYNKLQTKDKEPVVLTRNGVAQGNSPPVSNE